MEAAADRLFVSLAARPFRMMTPCTEKTRLRTTFQSAADQHDRVLEETVRARGSVAKQEYERLRAIENQARADRNAARLALERHKEEHGC